MSKTFKTLFQTKDTGHEFGNGLLRWGGGAILAALGIQAIYSFLWVWE
jgi:hypothetical protein